ncbi:MAG: aldehyde dehydrogenase family protein [Devosia sp.]|uniref:aldehyde dehydrogenase family protein n=1 Tax=Devosia sp. TaxID=1871048 RepID=UPI00263740DC|nr:aldehyde dehydrogenase family protein [Devosia sp.]MDB5541711.1 aldehyde dehydrogenase family protein [Devosia sp.]
MSTLPFKPELFFGGAWHASATSAAVFDKFSTEPAWSVALPSATQIAEAVSIAHAAHRAGAPTEHERARILERAIDIVASRADAFRLLMAVEAGFPSRDADGEISRCGETLKLSAIAARQLTGETIPFGGAPGGAGRMGYTVPMPVGPVLAVTPFNSPLNTVTHKIAPAFAAGNPVILKPSLHTPGTAALLVQCLHEAGVPAGFLGLLHGGPDVVSAIIEDQRIRFITFTGGTAAGASIQSRAGLRRTSMELGSIASTILCADADLKAAIPKVVAASFRKAGQVCSSIQLLHVARPLYEQVVDEICAGGGALSVGDPCLAATDVGPLVSVAAAERVEAWVNEAVAQGARAPLAGKRDRACYTPAVLTDVTVDMRVTCEEIFGPVVSIIPFDEFGEAIERVNASPYGLACGVFTRDLGIVDRAVAGIDVGGLHINETSSSRLDLMPYGGVKASGFGHEGPHYAVREMTEDKLVTIRM